MGEGCGTCHDRDLNAANNIVNKAFALDGTHKLTIPQAMGKLTLLDSRCSNATG